MQNKATTMSFADKKALVSRLNMIDDEFFPKIVEDIGASEELIQTILGNKKISIIKSETQVSIRNVGNKSVVLDLLCTDETGRLFNVEVQRSDDDDHQKRMRYYASNIDTKSAEKGIEYRDLPDIFSIMISEFDIFKLGKTVYHVSRILEEDNSKQDNGIHELYVNANGKDGGNITELMEYMLNSNGYNEKFPRISNRVNYFKEDRTGVSNMSKVMEEIRAEGKAEAKAEGRSEERAEVLKVLGISKEEYEKRLAEYQAN
ncbi:MAG: PD-(D/E)XK nuclease family transposase [Bacillota bacterium]|nr:PD-(D/E)XK nuclease family transposase [Bacillota bacterium]